MITLCSEKGKTIPVPVALDLAAIMLFQSGVRCGSCNLCCREVKEADLLKDELRALQSKYGTGGFTDTGLKFPCRFLDGAGKCTIYTERPVVCMIYPIQPSAASSAGALMAVDSQCPQAREIALKLYMIAWDFRNKRENVKVDDAERRELEKKG